MRDEERISEAEKLVRRMLDRLGGESPSVDDVKAAAVKVAKAVPDRTRTARAA
jgi:hypothetical protein